MIWLWFFSRPKPKSEPEPREWGEGRGEISKGSCEHGYGVRYETVGRFPAVVASNSFWLVPGSGDMAHLPVYLDY